MPGTLSGVSGGDSNRRTMEQTLKNLAKAFIGESQARNRYAYYSKAARTEGYHQISGLFALTAENEKEHAKMVLKMINELKGATDADLTEIVVEAVCPTTLGTTAENLRAAIAGEHYETAIMYPGFADVASEEGLPQIAGRLRSIARAEAHHEDRYTTLLEQVEAGTFFKKEEEVEWVCRECGYVHVGTEPPKKCPACNHDREYYELKCERY